MRGEQPSGEAEAPQNGDSDERRQTTQHPKRAVLRLSTKEPITLKHGEKQGGDKHPECVFADGLRDCGECLGTEMERGNDKIRESAGVARQFVAEPGAR